MFVGDQNQLLVLIFHLLVLLTLLHLWKSQLPCSFSKCFFDESIDLLAEQTNLYSVLKSENSVNTNSKEIKQFLKILIMMGEIKLPRYRMYWSQDTQIPVIAEVMGVTRFENLKRFFHCNVNQKCYQKVILISTNFLKFDQFWTLF